jgi:uncharacterized protein (TIGR03032 family)
MAYQAHKVILVRMPGFTRGLDCIELLAFVELSQVRKSAVFGGIPLVGKLKARTCGIWAAHIATGQPLGFLHLEARMQEIFAVQVLDGMRLSELLEW